MRAKRSPSLKPYIFLVLLLCACAAALYSLAGDENYGRLSSLRKGLAAQKKTNAELSEKVANLKSKVTGLRTDDRELEKSARNELGMARPNELIFLFEKKEEGKQQEARY